MAVQSGMTNKWLAEQGLISVTVGENIFPCHGPVILVKRPVRTRMQGVGGEKPPATLWAFAFVKTLFLTSKRWI